MLRNNFIAAQNAREPLEISQDATLESTLDPGAQGNAFAGNRANQDHEMYHAIHGAIMDDNAGGSSAIANAGMRVAAKLGSAATRSEKEAEKSRGMYMQVMNQQLQKMRDDLEATLNAMREKYDEMDEQLDALAKLRELVNDGNFDPTNAEHVELYNKAFNNDPEMSPQEFAFETQSQQNDTIDDTEHNVQTKQVELERDMAEIQEKWDQTIEIDPNGEDPDVISQRMASFEEYTTAMNEKYQLEADNASEAEPAPQNTMASNFVSNDMN